MKLYHASTLCIENPDVLHSRDNLDFGRGFYLTSSLQQAVSYIPSSIRKNKRRGILPNSFRVDDGIVSIFHFQPNPNLFIHYFNEADVEWLHFVACNRDITLFSELRQKYASVDIIGGKVADDQTALTLNNYISGAYGEPGTLQADTLTINFLETERLKDQFCFRTADAIKSLVFVRSEKYGDIRK